MTDTFQGQHQRRDDLDPSRMPIHIVPNSAAAIETSYEQAAAATKASKVFHIGRR